MTVHHEYVPVSQPEVVVHHQVVHHDYGHVPQEHIVHHHHIIQADQPEEDLVGPGYDDNHDDN